MNKFSWLYSGFPSVSCQKCEREDKVRKRTILQPDFHYRVNRGPPPRSPLWFQTKGFASHVGVLFAARDEREDVGDTHLVGPSSQNRGTLEPGRDHVR